MCKLSTALVIATLLAAGLLVVKAEAATTTGLGSLAPLTKTYSPVETVGCWCGPYRCACRRYWGPRYYGYYGWRRPYYRYRY
jgi:hypothetical protein